jgi:site-specific DNA-methyltransferase (adenine-specific)
MATLPDASVDMILCDLPYGTTACKWDSVIPFKPLWAQYRRIAKKNAAIVLTADQPFTAALLMSNPRDYRHRWVWDKVNRITGFLDAKKRPLRVVEDVLVFCTGQPTYTPQMWQGEPYKAKHGISGAVYNQDRPTVTDCADGMRYPQNIIRIKADNRGVEGRVHPTQKPVALMEYLIRSYTHEGDVVLDNCMGSGTTGVACVNTGCGFIGIERDDRYFQIARDRIEAAGQKSDLFAA